MSSVAKRPLAGRRVVVTRQVERSASLSERLSTYGAQTILCPTIRITPPTSSVEMDCAISQIESYRWVVFPSANSARSTLQRMQETGISLDRLEDVSLAAVGPATRGELEIKGAAVSYVPDEYVAERLGETLNPVMDERILVMKADIGGSALADILTRRGAQVDEVVAYQTVPQAPVGNVVAELKRGVDVLTFTSPSTVRGFIEVGPDWRDLTVDVMIATIGPLTSEAARKVGMGVHVEAKEHTMEGLVSAIVTMVTGKAGG